MANLAVTAARAAPPGASWVNPHLLHPHPRNALVYGEEEDISDLVASIDRSGWIKPLVVTPDKRIISGHRRWRAALILSWERVPVEARAFSDERAELEALLLENATRVKSSEQKVREAALWKEIEGKLARARMGRGGAASAPGRKGMENFPPLCGGKTRDRVAARVGFGSGRTYEKARKVVARIDAERERGRGEIARALRQVLNDQSVDAAYQLLKCPTDERESLLHLLATGEAKTTQQAKRSISLARVGTRDPYRVGEVAWIDLAFSPSVEAAIRRWHQFWGIVRAVSELGIVTVDVGAAQLPLLPGDLKPLESPSARFGETVERVLRLRRHELDEIEVAMLDVLQRRVAFTPHQLVYLEQMEALYR